MNHDQPSLTAASAPPAPRPTAKGQRAIRTRRVILCVVYGLLSLVTLLMASGVIGLLAGDAPPDEAFGYGAVTYFKLLSLGGYLVLAATAGRSVVAAQWVVVGQLTWLITDLIAPQDPSQGWFLVVLQYVAITMIYLGPWLLLAPERRQVLHLQARPDRIALAVMVAALPALVVWTRHMADLTPTSTEGNFDAVGIAVVLAPVGVFAALRPRGRRWPLGVVAAGTFYLGIIALATPHDALGSPGLLGAAGLLLVSGLLAWRALQEVPEGIPVR